MSRAVVLLPRTGKRRPSELDMVPPPNTLCALVWHDVLSIVLVGFFVTNTLHAVNHRGRSGPRRQPGQLVAARSRLAAGFGRPRGAPQAAPPPVTGSRVARSGPARSSGAQPGRRRVRADAQRRRPPVGELRLAVVAVHLQRVGGDDGGAQPALHALAGRTCRRPSRQLGYSGRQPSSRLAFSLDSRIRVPAMSAYM